MQVPEKLALIGGSILLSSTLVFTLKSQASSIIPSVGHSISHVFNHIGDAQKGSDFDSNFEQAQKNGEITGTWGTAKYYIDNHNSINDLHVGNGQLNGQLYDVLGKQDAFKLNTVNFDQSVQAPQDSTALIDQLQNVTHINGIDNIDTSSVTNTSWMFASDQSLQSLDLSGWKLSRLSHGNHMFANDPQLRSLNISDFNNPHAEMSYMLGGDWTPNDSKLSKLVLGPNSYTRNWIGISDSNWSNGHQTLSNHYLLTTPDNITHPGTWIKQ